MSNIEKIRCAYCGEKREKAEVHEVEITFRDRDPWTGKAFVNKRKNWYCKDKPCAGYDQMAHEG